MYLGLRFWWEPSIKLLENSAKNCVSTGLGFNCQIIRWPKTGNGYVQRGAQTWRWLLAKRLKKPYSNLCQRSCRTIIERAVVYHTNPLKQIFIAVIYLFREIKKHYSQPWRLLWWVVKGVTNPADEPRMETSVCEPQWAAGKKVTNITTVSIATQQQVRTAPE